jgi:molybdopterin molybdotransferase
LRIWKRTVLVKLKGFQKLTSPDEALTNWLNAWPIKKPAGESLGLGEVNGRVLAEDLVALDDLPRFDKSAMDGYAIRYTDSKGASQDNPVKLKVTVADEVKAGEAKQIWTGNPIPKGADAVIMIEETERQGETLEIWVQLAPSQNISRHGEDVKKDQIIAKAGTRLNPYHIGLAAALGYSKLKVYVKPKIAILATGNEIVEVGTQPGEHQIFDSNKVMLSAMCRELGAEVVDFGIVKDNLEEITEKIRQALKNADALITTGGTSVGGLDLVHDAINKVGNPGVIAHGLTLRPAMPTGVAVLESKPVMILSGNPVASVIGFEVFGRAALCRLLGLSKTEEHPALKAKMTKKISGALGRKTYVRVLVKVKGGEFVADPVSAKGAGAISTMTLSNGYVVIPPDREGLTEGETVSVQMFGSLEAEA